MKKVSEEHDITNFKKLKIYYVGSGDPKDEHDISGVMYYDRIDKTKLPVSLYVGVRKFEDINVTIEVKSKDKYFVIATRYKSEV